MLSDAELESAARDLESDRVERKAALTGDGREKLGQAICAFANDLAGHGRAGLAMIGVDDAGRATGLPITDTLLQTLAAFRSDGNILPIPSLVVQKRKVSGVDIAVVEVEPALDPPVRFRGQVWVRIGPRRATASRDEERVLTERRRHGHLPFDLHTVPGATLADLDVLLFLREVLPATVAAEVIAENGRAPAEQLAALHLATPDARPTIAGLVLCGFDPQRWVPGAYLQFARFDGPAITDPIIDEKQLRGTLPAQLRLIDDLLKIHIKTAVDVGTHITERRHPDYPLAALQQLVRNAVLHRNFETSHAPVQVYWYSDRVEIHNPGGLFGRVTPETFGQPGGNDYRNPTLAAFFKALGFVQQFGLGIPLARKACAENGNPRPDFAFRPMSFQATIRSVRPG